MWHRSSRPRICRNVILTACSRGVLPLESNHACNFPMLNSCVVVGASTATFSRVPGPTAAIAKPVCQGQHGGFVKRRGDTETVCVIPAPSSKETRQVLDTNPG